MRIVAVPLASKIHERGFYEELIKRLRPEFEKNGLEVVDVVDGDLSKEVVDRVKGSVPMIIVLTGGTSDLAIELIEKSGSKRALLLSHSQHNSLASAISIRSRAKGVAVRNYFEAVDKAIRMGKALKELLGVRVGVISDGVEDRKFEEMLDAKVFRFGHDCLELSGMDVDEVVASTRKRIEIPNDGAARRALELYAAMKKLALDNQLSALAIDCFPYLVKHGITPCIAVALLNDDGIATACEADLRSLALMLMAKSLGKTPWMANVASVRGRRLTIAHCTMATKLGVDCKLVPHFESGLPYSLACRLEEGEYTLAGIDRECSLVAAIKVRLIKSGLIHESMCRTQALLEAAVDLSDFPNTALGNHHILTPGDIVNDLKELANLLSMKFVNYEKIL